MTPNRHALSENFKTANYHSYQAVTTNDIRRLENSVKNAQAVMSVVYNNNSTPASVPDSGEPPAPTSGGSESDDDIAPVRASYDTGSHTHQTYDDDEAPPALIPLRNFRNNEDLLPALVNDDSNSDDDEKDESDKNT